MLTFTVNDFLAGVYIWRQYLFILVARQSEQYFPLGHYFLQKVCCCCCFQVKDHILGSHGCLRAWSHLSKEAQLYQYGITVFWDCLINFWTHDTQPRLTHFPNQWLISSLFPPCWRVLFCTDDELLHFLLFQFVVAVDLFLLQRGWVFGCYHHLMATMVVFFFEYRHTNTIM